MSLGIFPPNDVASGLDPFPPPAISGGGGGAPTGAQYITLATDATLTSERVLTAGTGIGITDGGAGGAVTIVSKVFISTSAPSSPAIGTLWFKPDEPALKIYYDDGDSSQWVDVVASNPVGTGATTRIAKTVCVGGETTITFSAIPQTYTDLEVVWTGRDSAAGTSLSSLRLRFNGDSTASNYSNTFRTISIGATLSAAAQSSTTLGVQVGVIPNAGNAAGTAGGGKIVIPAYAGTSLHKRVVAIVGEDDTTNVSFVGTLSTRWANTAAINQIQLATDGSGFVAGSTLTLYGLG